MKAPSSFRQLLRDLNSLTKTPPSWVLLHPGQSLHQRLWTAQSGEILPVSTDQKTEQAVEKIPVSGNLATGRAQWAVELTRRLVGDTAESGNLLAVLPLRRGAKLVACLGWIENARTAGAIKVNVPLVRQAIWRAWALEMARSECEALRWVVSRCDRLVAAVRPGGELLASSPAFTDLLNSMRLGPRHYFDASSPKLPETLAQAIAQASEGQIKLSETCTARFDLIVSQSDCWQPIIGIEIFVEGTPHQRLPSPISVLTAVERQVFDLIKTGATNKEIAGLRGTAFSTTKNQVSAILSKMGVSRRLHLLTGKDDLLVTPVQLERPGIYGVANSMR